MESNELTRKPTILTQLCVEQLEEAFDFYAEKASVQVEIMNTQLSEIRKIIEILPGIGISYKNGIKYLGLGKFPYNIYYREIDDAIEILGIWHTSRGTEFEP